MFAFCGARSIFYILLQITTYRLQTSFCSTLGWIASRFYSVFTVLWHWCKYVCICRYYNCEYDNIQPMVESHPCFIAYAPCFLHCYALVIDVGAVIVNMTIYNLWLNLTHILWRARQVSVLLRPSYRYRCSNCKHPINQPRLNYLLDLWCLQRVLIFLHAMACQ